MNKGTDQIARALARQVKVAVDAPPGGRIEKDLLKVKLRGLSPASVEGYRSDLRQYLEYTAGTGRAPGDADALEAYKKALLKGGLKPTSVNRKLVAIKRYLLAYAMKAYQAGEVQVLRGMYREVKAIRLSDGEKAVPREKILSEAEAEVLLEALPIRIRMIAELLLQTGARISEALGIRISEVRQVNGHSEITVVGKGGKARTLLVARELLERIREEFKGQELLFQTRTGQGFSRGYICRELVRASERALGRRITPHCLRHSFATWTLARTHKLKGVSEYLGHSDPAVTLRAYIHEKLEPGELLGKGGRG